MATTGKISYYPLWRGRVADLQVLQTPHAVALQVPQIPRCAALQVLQSQRDVDIFDVAMLECFERAALVTPPSRFLRAGQLLPPLFRVCVAAWRLLSPNCGPKPSPP
jgi:hypothetical protein